MAKLNALAEGHALAPVCLIDPNIAPGLPQTQPIASRVVEAPRRPTSAETNLHSEGAEFLVLANLLIRGVHATKAYTNYPGWDVLATNPETGQTCRIQVKARLRTDYNRGFPIKNFDAEFVVHVALNRGYLRPRRGGSDTGERPPEFFILPMPVIVKVCESAPMWGASSKVFLRNVPDVDQYRDAWHLIIDHLGVAK